MQVISAIVLAAGESKRMGSPKMLLDFGGMTMLERVIAGIKGSQADEIIVVLGAYRDLIEKRLVYAGVTFCYNERYSAGMLSSVQCGFKNLPEGTDIALVFQGDQPFITSDVINKVIESHVVSGKGLAMPVYKGRRGHPLLVARKYFADIENLDPQRGLRSLSEIFFEDVQEVPVQEAGILRDFDTFEDYSTVANQI